ncbi:unnamed protein product [Paramecium pentaurelia]|uniref:Uncharacterized protein n=1 Tax=Paramecium pentaurelia TaxID=43138 RepID=A0A8S1V1F8_9CILI|nr:unnamed protein product [Paramecium pentaurelia]
MNRNNQDSSISTLVPILQRQCPTGRITLNDMYIGDMGAKLVADTIKNYPNIGILDLKGNNIGSNGFIDIFQALKTNISLRTLTLQWNQICANNNLKALELLYQVMSINKSITHIDLQNNRLNTTCAGLLANIIRNNPQLRTLDLRWNELGNQGVRLLIPAVAANGYILSIEIQGNGAIEDSIRELNSVLKQNKENVNMAGMQDPGRSQGRYQPGQRQPLKEMAQHLEEERRAVAKHLEKLIERERALGLQLKEEYEEKTLQWRQKLLGNQEKQDQLERNAGELQNHKNILKNEIQKWDNNIKQIQQQRSFTTKALEERQQQTEKNIRDLEKKQQEELTEQQRGHFFNLREIDNDWGQKCDQMMDENRKLDDHIQVQSQQCNKIKDDIAKFNSTTQIQTMEVIEKVKKLVLEEFKQKLNQMEKQVERIDQDRLKIIRESQQSILEAQKELRQITEQYSDMLKDKVRMELENRNLSVDNYQLEQFQSMISQDFIYRKDLEKKVLEQLTKIKEKEFKINNHEVEQLNKINNNFKNDTTYHSKFKEDSRHRDEALDKTLRDSDIENHKLAKDINKLTELLSAKTTKAVLQTFQEHKVF